MRMVAMITAVLGALVLGLLVAWCDAIPREQEREDAEIRAWRAWRDGEVEAAVWARRRCCDPPLFSMTCSSPRACTRDDLTQLEEVAFERWRRLAEEQNNEPEVQGRR